MSSQPPPPPPGPAEPADHAGHSEPQQPEPQPDTPTQQQSYGAQQPYPGQSGPPGQQGYAAQPQYGPPTGQSTSSLSASEEKTWSILAHLSAPIAFLISAGLLNFVGPLIIWAIYKDRSEQVRRASAGAFNFNLSIWIVSALMWLLVLFTLGVGLIVAVPVWIVLFIGSMVLHVMGAVKASNGEIYTYPLQLPVLK